MRPRFETEIRAWDSVAGVFRGLVDALLWQNLFCCVFLCSLLLVIFLCTLPLSSLNFLELKASSCLDFRGHGEKFFHADQGYFRLYPSNVAAYWIALDTADETNGTMHGANLFNDLRGFQLH